MARIEWKKWSRMFCVVVGGASLSACQVHAPKQMQLADSISQALQSSVSTNQKLTAQKGRGLPSEVSSALVPNVAISSMRSASKSKHFDVSVKDVPANMFFMGLVQGTDYNMVVDPSVAAKISITLKNVTIPEAIDAVCQAYGLGYRKTDYGYRILSDGLQTQIFTVSYLDIDRSGTSETTVGSGQSSSSSNNDSADSGSEASESSSDTGSSSSSSNSNSGAGSSSVSTITKSNFWKVLDKTLTTIVGTANGHQVVVNPQAGIVLVRAYPSELRDVAHYLDSTQSIMDRQVVLEAKVLEIQLNAQYQAGINWNLLGMKVSDASLSNTYADFNSIFSVDASHGGTFSAMMKLLNTQGRVQVLSSPRISTLNNQKAIIKVGGDEYFVTNISNTTVAGATGSSDSATQDVNLTSFFSGIALDVTPEIGPNGEVTLHIHPIVSETTEDPRSFTLSGQETKGLPLAKTSIRETDSIVRAKNGQVIVIGGLMEGRSEDYNANTPGMDQTPLKPLFDRDNYRSEKTELVILLKPTVVGSHTWSHELHQDIHRFNNARLPFSYTFSSGSDHGKVAGES
jgi:MSHA biogenesis protein MshL